MPKNNALALSSSNIGPLFVEKARADYNEKYTI